MSRYTGAKLKITRRLGPLPGLCQSKPNPKKGSGSAFNDRKKNVTQYGIRLIEKQKLRFNYGISESQLINYVRKAKKTKGKAGVRLLTLLEMRLDTIVFRFGLAPTIVAARQLVNHGHISINQRCVSIPSYQCRPNDVISINNRGDSKSFIKLSSGASSLPPHLTFDEKTLVGKVTDLPRRESVKLQINELLVIEYYSRKI